MTNDDERSLAGKSATRAWSSGQPGRPAEAQDSQRVLRRDELLLLFEVDAFAPLGL